MPSRSPRPDITLFIPDFTGGGAERVMVNLAMGMSERGVRVDLLVLEAKGPYLEHVPDGVRVVELEPSRTSRSVWALRRYLRRSDVRVVVSALHHTNLALLAATKPFLSRTRCIVTLHNTFSKERRDARSMGARLRYALIAASYRMADGIVAVSHEAADDFSNATNTDRNLIETIYNPVITPELFRLAQAGPSDPWFSSGQGPVILGVGRLKPQKDFETLIRALAIVRETRNARLAILGEGERRAELEGLAQSLGVAEHVYLPGFVANPYGYMDRASVFVLSSSREGLPTALIEALALGTPIVSTDCRSGPREILADGTYGELVPVGEPEPMADAIVRALRQPKTRRNPEAWAPYDRDVVVERYLRYAGVSGRA